MEEWIWGGEGGRGREGEKEGETEWDVCEEVGLQVAGWKYLCV